ncbi:uncharacterized protein TNCV_4165201 [Trichonephila clavipes]|nr:uncharacterized protein TNCV_4165201 [Trichonephila clavipes]
MFRQFLYRSPVPAGWRGWFVAGLLHLRLRVRSRPSGRDRTVACLVTSSSPVPLKTRRVGQRCTLNLSRAETSSRWCGVVVRGRGVPAQVSSTSFDHGSKLRGPSPKSLVQLNSATLIINQSIVPSRWVFMQIFMDDAEN